MRLFELCSLEDRQELFQLLVGKAREVMGLDQSDVANFSRIDSTNNSTTKPRGIVRAKGVIPAKQKARKKGSKKRSQKTLATPPQIPGQAPTAPAPGQRAPIKSNQPERGAFGTKNVAGHNRWLYEPSTFSKYPDRPSDQSNINS